MIRFKVFPRRGLFGRRWYFNLTASNGEIIAQSEPYKRRIDCLHALATVARTDGSTPVDIEE
jgi:uncharacterized protein YegP (UPF0339 family)